MYVRVYMYVFFLMYACVAMCHCMYVPMYALEITLLPVRMLLL